MARRRIAASIHDRNRSLGWLGLAWAEHFTKHGRGGARGMAVVHGQEFSNLWADCYALDETGRRLYDSVFVSRPKGCDKSGFAGRISLFEAFGPCRFDGWAEGGETYEFLDFVYTYSPGEPMGRRLVAPVIRCMATEEQQAGNTYDTIYYNLTEGELSQLPGMQAGLGISYTEDGGQIIPSTASSASKDGALETFAVGDEVHLWTTPSLRNMYDVVTNNLVKRRSEGSWMLLTTTMFQRGQDSIAERTFEMADRIEEAQAAVAADPNTRLRVRRERLLFDHRWGDCENIADEDELRAGITEAYGDAILWIDVESIIDEFYDERKSIENNRRYFLNSPTSVTDAWVTSEEWDKGRRDGKYGTELLTLNSKDMITLGFDGSTRDDSTVLVACRPSDLYCQVLAHWDKPEGSKPEDEWRVDIDGVNRAVEDAFDQYRVIGFYADPAGWWDSVNRWNAKYGNNLKLKATQRFPIEWETKRPAAVVPALEQTRLAIISGELLHNDPEGYLRRHVLNARNRVAKSNAGIWIAKEYPKSPNKIDAAYAMMLAFTAAEDAIKQNLVNRKRRVIKVLR